MTSRDLKMLCSLCFKAMGLTSHRFFFFHQALYVPAAYIRGEYYCTNSPCYSKCFLVR